MTKELDIHFKNGKLDKIVDYLEKSGIKDEKFHQIKVNLKYESLVIAKCVRFKNKITTKCLKKLNNIFDDNFNYLLKLAQNTKNDNQKRQKI